MRIRFLEPSDIEACNDFHNRAYGTSRTVRQWHWQFDRPDGERLPFIVVEEDGQIVGTQALMPITMVDSGGDIPTAKSEETLVDRSMRGKGIFQKMYEPLFEYARTQGIQSIWGFTPAQRPFESVGFRVPGRTSQLLLPLNQKAASAFGEHLGQGVKASFLRTAIGMARVVSAARLALARGKAAGLRLEILDTPPAVAGELCRRFVRGWGGVTILRDAAYLEWRYCRNPYVRATLVGAYRDEELLGWIAYSVDDASMGFIVDVVVPPAGEEQDTRDIVYSLFQHAVLELRACGSVAIRCWTVNQHPFDSLVSEIARTLGFYVVRRGEPAVIHATGGDAQPMSLHKWDNWYVTRAFTQGESG